MKALSNAPKTITIFNEILVEYPSSLAQLWNGLKPEERIFIYYLWRASIPGNRILVDQIHRHGLEIRDIFKKLHENKHRLKHVPSEFANQVETFLVYLETNHGQYFQREMSDEKRTPAKLGLNALTRDSIKAALLELGFEKEAARLDALATTLFDASYESTNTVSGDIGASSVNFYSPDFTSEDYKKLSPEERGRLNAAFSIDEKTGKPLMHVYSVNERYSRELRTAVFWINKAHQHAQGYPESFDVHLVKSLELLEAYLVSGKEELFREHSIEWLKSAGKVGYTFGVIETYKDPMSVRGSFEAEATIKTIDISALNAILPGLEKQLPFPQEFKRESLESALPNASINTKVFGTGEHGPIQAVAAYALPNYEDIRSTYGTKQIIYPSDKSVGELLNPELRRKLFFSRENREWLEKHDPESRLLIDLWDVHVILHETLGHGSGRLATHTFKQGENLTVEGVTYKVGDTIPVTGGNNAEFLEGYDSTLEELRAEIIALYTSIEHLDELTHVGLLDSWVKKVGKQDVKKWLVLEMVGSIFRRYLQQADGATQVAGDHARANATISEYLFAHGGVEIVREQVELDKVYTVIDVRVSDFEKVMQGIKELMIKVQHIKSTGDTLAIRELVDTYGKPLRLDVFKSLKENNKKVVGSVKARATIFPHFEPIFNEDHSKVLDIQASWPANIFEQIKTWSELELKGSW